MRCLVTGGAGFIGSNLVRRLADRGDEVAVLDDLSTGYRSNLDGCQAQLFYGSILDRDLLARAAAGAEVIFNLAASVGNSRSIRDPHADSMVNVIGVLNVLAAARACGARKVVHTSSAAIFGELKTLPIREDHPAEPDSPYGVSKLAGEKHALCHARMCGQEVVCLRYFNVYGPNQRFDAYGNVIPIFVTRLLRGEPLTIYGDGEQTRDFVNVADVVRANVLAADRHNVTGAYNVGSGTAVSINVLVSLLEEAAGTSAKVHYAPKRPGDVLHSLADLTAIRASLGFESSVALPDGLQEYVAWMRADLASRP